MSYKGIFKPKNPSKYLGNSSNIIYRSLWELKLMMYLDNHKDVLNWASEEIAVPYRSPLDRRIHRYFVDFYVKRKIQGMVKESLIEIKPKRQTLPPKVPKSKVSPRVINEIKTWSVNQAKWKAAEEFCKDKGWNFLIMTEDELNIK
jgi:hypothetical protein